MGQKPDTIMNNLTNGEISPRALGRFDISKFSNSAETVENFLISQLGGAFFRPGTRYVAATKSSTVRSRLLKFQYSTEQSYAIEAGDLYFRFYTDGGQLVSGMTPVELVTPYPEFILPSIKYAQNADTMYLCTGTYRVYKLRRTSATVFTIDVVNFARGPFLDTNVTTTTITPSGTGGAITLTASSSIFQSGHVGSLWRIAAATVLISHYTSATQIEGSVQTEPDGTGGDIGSTDPTRDWAEGSWSTVRGFPKVVTFHEGRLYFANTTHQPGGVWASVPFQYENFHEGAEDDDSLNFELNADTAVSIRWLSSSPKGLQAGTTGGVFVIDSGSQGLPVTPDNVNATRNSFEGSADIQGRHMGNYTYYVKNDLQIFLESGYQFDIDSTDSIDTTLLADHILNSPDPTNKPRRFDHESGGAFDIDSQQSPNTRMWIVRNDGQIAVLTRNVRQEVNGWSRITGGQTISCDGYSGTGVFESIVILQQEGEADIIWVQVNRLIGGVVKRLIEYFTPEKFKYEWDAVRLDSSLTLDEPIEITNISLASPVVITAPAHGLSNGDQIRLDNIVGTHQLNGREFIVWNVATDTFELGEVS